MEFPREAVLQVDKLCKLYARSDRPIQKRLAQEMLRGFFGGRPPEIDDPQRGEFWALRDVSFDLRRGEALGVIGLNGSGKTTLLRILAGQILPDRGEVRVTGATAAMIDLTAGFQPTASGRRNIFLRAAALGFTRREILALQDEIIAFSELGDAIDAPMKTYSSGMKMRLAFSVMAMLQPDILFIDEVLAVGDFRFRQKCLARIREMRARSAFVFVSHAMGDVSRFCDRVIVLHKGEIAFQGSPDDAIAFYKTLEQNSEPAKPASKPLIPDTVDRPDLVDGLSFAWGDAEGTGKNEIIEGMPVGAKITFNVHYEPRNLIVGVPIYDMEGAVLAGFATDANGVTLRPAAGDRVDLELFVPDSVLNPGRFRVAIGITDGTEFLLMRELPNLIIRPNGRKSWGVASIPHTWRCGIAAAAKTTV